ncbi:MAG: SDR family NAD(P)-dependent oxidoreductase, partial [Proteobacteria bacterium]
MDLKLVGKTALVTGSSKGIGEAIARTLAREGAAVVIHGRDPALVGRVAAGIVADGGRAHAVSGDLTHDDAVDQLVKDARDQAGPIGILVNNAGGSAGSRETWNSSDPAAWMAAYDRNVLAALRALHDGDAGGAGQRVVDRGDVLLVHQLTGDHADRLRDVLERLLAAADADRTRGIAAGAAGGRTAVGLRGHLDGGQQPRLHLAFGRAWLRRGAQHVAAGLQLHGLQAAASQQRNQGGRCG